MKKLYFCEETFYYSNGKFYDSSFFELPLKDCADLWTQFLSTIDLKTLKFDEFIELVNQLDNGENYGQCITLIEQGFEIYFDQQDYAKLMLPKLFRLYRLQNQSSKVIEVWEKFWSKKIKLIESSALYVVLGASYCDINLVEEAERYAKKAYRLQSGSPNEYLNNLFMRIRSLKN